MSTGDLVTIGEVHTGLLQNSSAISLSTATRLVDVVLGERVLASERPTSYVRSVERLTGLDCPLPSSKGARVRAVGTVVSRSAITGGHVLQGSVYARIRRGEQS